jgi:hypothetical protein
MSVSPSSVNTPICEFASVIDAYQCESAAVMEEVDSPTPIHHVDVKYLKFLLFP